MWHRLTAHSILPKEGKKAENPLKINELSTFFGGVDDVKDELNLSGKN